MPRELRGWRVGVVCALVAMAGWCGAKASRAATELVPADRGPGGQALVLWEVSQSWPGDAQYDSRLEQPVALWQPGMALPEVFREIEGQTGVKIGLWPEGDQNARVRVHLFLNPKQPPTLRDLMAQLSWVVDCQFAFAESGPKVYYLMGTNMAQGAPAAIKARKEQAARNLAQQQQALLDKLGELKEALSLSREDAIARYQGVDDRTLLDLLDPAQRGAARIVVNRILPMLEETRLPDNGAMALGTGLIGLTPEEQAALKDAFGLKGSEFSDPEVALVGLVKEGGRVALLSPRVMRDGKSVPAGNYKTDSYDVVDLRPEAELAPEEQVALRRALGETITPEQEKQYLAARRAEQEAAAQSALKQAGTGLSERARELLKETRLKPGGSANWQIEEAVAKATGMNVISDGLLYASGRGGASALQWLESFCSRRGEQELRSPEWEWGDAGTFLRFRTTNRDVWRAAMLPQELVDWMDAQTRAYLPDDGQATSVSFRLALEPEPWTRYLGRLSDLQVRYGARVIHGDPRDLLEAARRATWEQVCPYVQMGLGVLRLMGGLSPDQWRLLRSGNLRSPADITPDQREAMEAVLLEGSLRQQLPVYSRVHISLGEVEPDKQGALKTNELDVWNSAAGQASSGASATGSFGEGEAVGWFRAIFAAVAVDQQGQETRAFTRKAAFLPKEISVHAAAPE